MNFINSNIVESVLHDIIFYFIKCSLNFCKISQTISYSNFLIFACISSATINFTILLLLILSFINFFSYTFFKKNKIIFFFTKLLNIISIIILVIIFIIKLSLNIKFENSLNTCINEGRLYFFNNFKFIVFDWITPYTSSFSDLLFILCLITSFFCVCYLGNKNIFSNINNMTLLFIFNFLVLCMVYTNNLLVMFFIFEFLFLLTMYFVYKFSYSIKVMKSIEFFFKWTFFGSFLVLCCFAYIYYYCNTLNLWMISLHNFSNYEQKILFLMFIIGFGIKLPLPPFHTWLIKVHVEAPTGFSMFLSGFLVKSALYCLFMVLSIFHNRSLFFIIYFWVLSGLIISTYNLNLVTDIKKLVAWATVQEMTFILFFLISKQYYVLYICFFFIILHGILSIYMFLLVDILYKKYKSRFIHEIQGTHYTNPQLTKYIWFLILLYSGFPLTIKFYIEWSFISIISDFYWILTFYLLFIINICGSIFFTKHFLSILYGTPSNTVIYTLQVYMGENEIKSHNFYFFTLTNIENKLLFSLVHILICLNFLIYFI